MMVSKTLVRRLRGEDDESFFARRVAIYTEFDPNTGCHLWSSATDRDGYPRLKHGVRPIGVLRKLLKAEPGTMLLHKCDTPQCINPNHVRPGTHLDNMRDKAQKGRALSVHSHKRSTMAERQLVENNTALPNRALARMTGLSCDTIRRIKAKILTATIPVEQRA